MKINKAFCFFEQSGTFKAAFRKCGVWAQDYDIQDEFGKTDHQIDLFEQINTAYHTTDETIFDEITPDDLIMAFFPCIYFAEINQMYFSGTSVNFRGLDKATILSNVIERSAERQKYYDYLLKLCYIVESRNLRCIIENPYSVNHYLYNNFPYKPAVIEFDRSLRGDYFRKPTQYFFLNCQPTNLTTIDRKYKPKKIRSMTGHNGTGICDTERSLISPEYAENFINDYILGIRTEKTQKTLFDNL